LIEQLRWNNFMFIYSQQEDLAEFDELISGWTSTSKVRPVVNARQLPSNTDDFRPFLKYIRKQRLKNIDLALLGDFLAIANGVFQCNITGIQIVKTDPPMKTELALTMDAIQAIGAALLRLKVLEQNPMPSSMLCDAHDRWTDGPSLNRAIRDVSMDSASTGKLTFTPAGQRTDLLFNGIGRINGEIVKVGDAF
uniref:ANF_receptor domain-containing protein n=1 Tax=Anisakis simplex TaxID=6269 RepID=A0A0M3IZ08_ANISI